MPFELTTLTPPDLAFLAAALLLIHLSRRWIALYALLALPGTFLHETAHWIVALLLGGQPTPPSIVPVRTGSGWRLGSVGIRRVRWFNALPIGVAPLALAPLAAIALLYAAGTAADRWSHWAGLYVAAAAAVLCLPSRADWKIVASRPLGLLAYAAAAIAAYLLLAR